MDNLEKAKSLLKSEDFTLVLCKGSAVHTSKSHGIRPMLDFLDAGVNMQGFSAADKVVGKAAAMLFAVAGIKEIYADILSKQAIKTLEQNGIKYSCGEYSEAIANCLMEQAVKDVNEPNVALQVLKLNLFALKHKLNLTTDYINKILQFCDLLLEANKSTNLVSKNDEKKLLTRHVADSLIFASKGVVSGEWVDVGSGAGFPVVPLCVYFSDLKFYAVENRKKRCEFLNVVKQKLGLDNLEIVERRAETCGLKNIDVVSCRAVGAFEDDFEIAKKMLKKGGHFLTVKTKRTSPRNVPVFDYRLPGEEMEYVLICLNSR